MGQVLLVDPHPVSRKVAAITLSNDGNCVDAAGSGESALSLLSAKPYDILITELALPDRSGLDLLFEGRRRNAALLEIAITNSSSAEVVIEAIRAGASDVVFRPITPANLQLTLDRVRTCRPRADGVQIRIDRGKHSSQKPAPVDAVSVPLVRNYDLVEKLLVENSIRHFGGNKAAAAKALGMHRRTLYRILARNEIQSTDEPDRASDPGST